LFHNQYDKSSFFEDVKFKDINDVLNQLLYDLCDKKIHKDEYMSNKNLEDLRFCMTSRKLLVVVDDVGSTETSYFKDTKSHCKSKVLVICQNWQILEDHVNEDGKVDMTLFNEEQGMELFISHAFGNANIITNDFLDLSKEIVKACCGLLLSLEVMGGFLCTKHKLELRKVSPHL
jgi:hypothetical protein